MTWHTVFDGFSCKDLELTSMKDSEIWVEINGEDQSACSRLDEIDAIKIIKIFKEHFKLTEEDLK